MISNIVRVSVAACALAALAPRAFAGEIKEDCSYLEGTFDRLTQIINARSMKPTIADIPLIDVYASLQRNVVMVYEARGCDVSLLVDLMRKEPDPELVSAVVQPEAEPEDEAAARDVTDAEEEVEAAKGPFVATKNANLRSKPTSKSPSLAVLQAGSIIPVVGKVKGENWYKVRLREGEGFVYGSLLRVADDLVRAAEDGDAELQYRLGNMFVQTDMTEAIGWWEAAGAQGHAGALFNLGVSYFKGETGARDLAKAEEYWTQAAGKGHEQAKRLLARLEDEKKARAAE